MNNNTKTVAGHGKRPSAPSVILENVSFSYPGKQIFRSLNFTVKGGQWTCLIGPSGCGKSTLLRLISGTLGKNFSGKIHFSDGDSHNGRTAWMAQKDLLLPWLSVLDNVCLGSRLRGEMSDQKRQKAISLLEDAGLGEYSDSLPSELSGGMRQRVALLRTLMEERPVILMDEPFSALDAHDPLEALRLGHRIYVMTHRPATLSKVLIPPGSPPREPGDPAIVSLQAKLLHRLVGRGNP
ncbi:MAG: ABC transporter ATP-binding protein [Deltaproteobacteria bacterium]|nr:ABC transporter ATP-binding protein [Deltaproteobacteria bacterium]